MSPILTSMHHHSLRSRPRHSGPRSGETSALRLARLAANLGYGIIQRTPHIGNANRGAQTKPPDCDVEDRTDAVKSAMVSRTADPFCIQGGMR
jgi:hypothetical protein